MSARDFPTAGSSDLATSGHTPGPWRLDRWDDANQDALIRLGCSADPDEWLSSVWMFTETEANARLIAAAPELLNGCNALLGLLTLLANRGDVPKDILLHLQEGHRIDEAKAAVAKATGAA